MYAADSTSRAYLSRFEALLQAVLHMAPLASIHLVSSLNPLRGIFSIAEDERTLKYPQKHNPVLISK